MTIRKILDMIDQERQAHAAAIRKLHDPDWDTYIADEISSRKKSIARLDRFRKQVIDAAKKAQAQLLRQGKGGEACRAKTKRTAV